MAKARPPTQPKWGKILQQRREARGWSLRWAAQQSGMSDVFWAQMERGSKRRRDGTHQEVTPSLGSLLQAATALRFTDGEMDELVTAAGYQPLPRRYAEGAAASVPEAIRNDPSLSTEGRAILLAAYDAATEAATPQQRRGRQADVQPPLRAVARGGRPEDRAEVRRLAKKARAEHDNNNGGKK